MARPYTDSLSLVTASYPTSVYTARERKNRATGLSPVTETFNVPGSAYGYTIELDYAISSQTSLTITDVVLASNLTVVPYEQNPGTTEAAVQRDWGAIKFAAANDARAMSVTYTPLGTVVTSNFEDQLQKELVAVETAALGLDHHGTNETSWVIDKDNAGAGANTKLAFNRGSTAGDATILWDESNDKFILYKVDATTVAPLDCGNISITDASVPTITFGGAGTLVYYDDYNAYAPAIAASTLLVGANVSSQGFLQAGCDLTTSAADVFLYFGNSSVGPSAYYIKWDYVGSCFATSQNLRVVDPSGTPAITLYNACAESAVGLSMSVDLPDGKAGAFVGGDLVDFAAQGAIQASANMYLGANVTLATADAYMYWGDAFDHYIQWDFTNSRFLFSHDLCVSNAGNLSAAPMFRFFNASAVAGTDITLTDSLPNAENGLLLGGDFTGFCANPIYAGDSTNHVKTSTDGVVLAGTATTWDDLVISPLTSKTPTSNAPTFDVFKTNGSGSTGVNTYKFSAGTEESLYFAVQFPHEWLEASSIYPHIHWAPETTADGTPANQKVVWGLEYTWANREGTYGNTTLDAASTHSPADANVVAAKHYVTALAAIAGTSKTMSSIMLCRVFRKSADGGDTYEGNAWLLSVDFHIQKDALGSFSASSKFNVS